MLHDRDRIFRSVGHRLLGWSDSVLLSWPLLQLRHPGEGRDPRQASPSAIGGRPQRHPRAPRHHPCGVLSWVPAFAGMTLGGRVP